HLIYSSRIAKLRGCKNEKDWSSEFCGVNGTRSGGILRGLCIPDDYKSEPGFDGTSHKPDGAWSRHHCYAGARFYDPAAIEPVNGLQLDSEL
ncbi:MAG: hypothetical protein ACXVIK_05805, partial [Halobacteriota archaeon]